MPIPTVIPWGDWHEKITQVSVSLGAVQQAQVTIEQVKIVENKFTYQSYRFPVIICNDIISSMNTCGFHYDSTWDIQHSTWPTQNIIFVNKTTRFVTFEPTNFFALIIFRNEVIPYDVVELLVESLLLLLLLLWLLLFGKTYRRTKNRF